MPSGVEHVFSVTLYPRVDVPIMGSIVKAGGSVEITEPSAVKILLREYATDYYIMVITASNGYEAYRASDGKAWIPVGSLASAKRVSGYHKPKKEGASSRKTGTSKKHDTSKHRS